jgi:hypothetical protein
MLEYHAGYANDGGWSSPKDCEGTGVEAVAQEYVLRAAGWAG